jgi:hypothetical protein
MKRVEEKTSKHKIHWRLGFYIIGLVVCILSIFTLIRFGTILFWVPVWSWLTNYLTDKTGLNLWLAKGLTALLIIPLIYISAMAFSWKKRKRKIGIVLLCATTAIICFGLFFITQDVYFSPKNGLANKWYIVTLQGEYKFSSTPGFDPISGKKYEAVTPQVMEEYNLQKQSAIYSALPEDQYFDKKTGQPVKWYAILPDKSIEFFPSPGVHPKYGTKLKPATKEIVMKLELAREKAEQERQQALEEKRRKDEESSRVADSIKTTQQKLEELHYQKNNYSAKQNEQKEIVPEYKNQKQFLAEKSFMKNQEIKLPLRYGLVISFSCEEPMNTKPHFYIYRPNPKSITIEDGRRYEMIFLNDPAIRFDNVTSFTYQILIYPKYGDRLFCQSNTNARVYYWTEN